MDRDLHKRYLDYREKHIYFGHPEGKQTPVLTPEAFAAADADLRALKAKGASRSAAEERRFLELETLLFFD
jgi:hypothetical protein